jgi:hypothetical protein
MDRTDKACSQEMPNMVFNMVTLMLRCDDV